MINQLFWSPNYIFYASLSSFSDAHQQSPLDLFKRLLSFVKSSSLEFLQNFLPKLMNLQNALFNVNFAYKNQIELRKIRKKFEESRECRSLNRFFFRWFLLINPEYLWVPCGLCWEENLRSPYRIFRNHKPEAPQPEVLRTNFSSKY